MSKFRVKVEHLPTVELHEISAADLQVKIMKAMPQLYKVKLDDRNYFYVSWEDWGKIFNQVQSGLPGYKEDKFDCENFADLVKVRVAERFGVNTCARADGWSYLGRHAWNIFFDGDSFYQLESQKAGDITDIDDVRYVPDEIVIG